MKFMLLLPGNEEFEVDCPENMILSDLADLIDAWLDTGLDCPCFYHFETEDWLDPQKSVAENLIFEQEKVLLMDGAEFHASF